MKGIAGYPGSNCGPNSMNGNNYPGNARSINNQGCANSDPGMIPGNSRKFTPGINCNTKPRSFPSNNCPGGYKPSYKCKPRCSYPGNARNINPVRGPPAVDGFGNVYPGLNLIEPLIMPTAQRKELDESEANIFVSMIDDPVVSMQLECGKGGEGNCDLKVDDALG